MSYSSASVIKISPLSIFHFNVRSSYHPYSLSISSGIVMWYLSVAGSISIVLKILSKFFFILSKPCGRFYIAKKISVIPYIERSIWVVYSLGDPLKIITTPHKYGGLLLLTNEWDYITNVVTLPCNQLFSTTQCILLLYYENLRTLICNVDC